MAYETWRYIIAGAIIIFALWRVGKARKKYGPLRKKRKPSRKY